MDQLILWRASDPNHSRRYCQFFKTTRHSNCFEINKKSSRNLILPEEYAQEKLSSIWCWNRQASTRSKLLQRILDRLDCSFPMENVFASDFIKVTTYLLRSCWIYSDESVQESLQKSLLAGFGHLERKYYPNIARLGWYLRLWQESGRFCLRLFLGHRLLKTV